MAVLAAEHDIDRVAEAAHLLAARGLQVRLEELIQVSAELVFVAGAERERALHGRAQRGVQLRQRRRHPGCRSVGAGGRMYLALAFQQVGAQQQPEQVGRIDAECAADGALFPALVAQALADHGQVDPVLRVAASDRTSRSSSVRARASSPSRKARWLSASSALG